MKSEELKTSGYKRLFAYGEHAAMNLIGSSKCGFTFYDGVPSMYSSYRGKRVNRADINGIGRMISQSGFFNRNGGYYTYDAQVAEAIGGYPKGAILKYKDTDAGYVRTVRSLISDNKYDFVSNPEYIDDEHWGYVDMIVPTSCRPRIFPDWKNIQGNNNASPLILSSADAEGIVIDRDSMLIIQSGPDVDHDAVCGDSPCYVWVNVKKDGQNDFHAAGMLAYIPPTSSAYGMTAKSSDEIWPYLEAKAKYTAYYSSSPIQIYLNAGDTVNISTNIDPRYSDDEDDDEGEVIPYEARYWIVPLEV